MVANIYTESGEEARDFTRLRNACFEQVGVLVSIAFSVGGQCIYSQVTEICLFRLIDSMLLAECLTDWFRFQCSYMLDTC